MSRKNGCLIACPVCGKEKYRPASHILSGRKYCSLSCAAKQTKNGFRVGHVSFLTESSKKKISESGKGKIIPLEVREKIRRTLTGVHHTLQRRKNISAATKGKNVGPNHHNWRGGHTVGDRHTVMQSLDYRIWRDSVFLRDNYTCQHCGKRGVKLNADHIMPYALYPDLRFSVNNGRTLCVDCHKRTDTWGGKTKKLMGVYDRKVMSL